MRSGYGGARTAPDRRSIDHIYGEQIDAIEGLKTMTLPKHPTLYRLNRMIDSLGELTPESEVRAQLCRDLAERIDRTRSSTTGAQSMALPTLVRQLEQSMDALLGKNATTDDFLRYLMGGDA